MFVGRMDYFSGIDLGDIQIYRVMLHSCFCFFRGGYLKLASTHRIHVCYIW